MKCKHYSQPRQVCSRKLSIPLGLQACTACQGTARAHRVVAGGLAARQVCRGLLAEERRMEGQGALSWPIDAVAQHSQRPVRPRDLQAGATSLQHLTCYAHIHQQS